MSLSFEEAARGAKRTIRVSQGIPEPKNVDVDIPAGQNSRCLLGSHHLPLDEQGPECVQTVESCKANRRFGVPSPAKIPLGIP